MNHEPEDDGCGVSEDEGHQTRRPRWEGAIRPSSDHEVADERRLVESSEEAHDARAHPEKHQAVVVILVGSHFSNLAEENSRPEHVGSGNGLTNSGREVFLRGSQTKPSELSPERLNALGASHLRILSTMQELRVAPNSLSFSTTRSMPPSLPTVTERFRCILRGN